MCLLSCLSWCKKTDKKEDDDKKEEQRSRQNFTRSRNTDRSTQKETTILSSSTGSSDSSNRSYRHRDGAAPILSSSSRRTYSTIPDRTKSFYDNVPSRELESHQLGGLNNLNFTESEISTIQKPIQTNIRQSSSRGTRNIQGYRPKDDEESSSRVVSYSTDIKSTLNDKYTSQSKLKENKQSYGSPSKLAKIPDARKIPVLEMSPNNTTKTQGRQTRSYSSNRYQQHSDSLYVNPKSYKHKAPRNNQYRLSNVKANEILQTTTKYLEANSTTASISSPVQNKFPAIISDQLHKPILVQSVTENSQNNISSRKNNTNLHKPFSVYDNVPVNSNSKSLGGLGKFHLNDTKFQLSSETSTCQAITTTKSMEEVNPSNQISSIPEREKNVSGVASCPKYEQENAMAMENKESYNHYLKYLEPDVNSKPRKRKKLPNQDENDIAYIPEQYKTGIIDQTSSKQNCTDDFTTIVQKCQNKRTLKTIQNDAHFETNKTIGTIYAASFPDAQFAEDSYLANTQANYSDSNVKGAEQPLSYSKEEYRKNKEQNLLIFPKDRLIDADNKNMQLRIQQILPSGKNHLNVHLDTYDTPVSNTFADKVIEVNKSKASVTENKIKDQKEDVSEQENKRREVKTKIDELHNTAKQFIEEIDSFEEAQDSSKYYYIEESLRRLVDTLDDMYEDIGADEYLRAERKKVYKCIFPLFEKLDEKVSGTSQF